MTRIKALKLTNPQIRLLLQLYEISQSGGHKTYSRMPDMLEGLIELDLVYATGDKVRITDKGVGICQE